MSATTYEIDSHFDRDQMVSATRQLAVRGVLRLPLGIRKILFYTFVLPPCLLIWSILFALRTPDILRAVWRWISGDGIRQKPFAPVGQHPAGSSRVVVLDGQRRVELFECGPEGAPVVLFLHGFPESPYSFRHQIKAFREKYRCIAVSLRGYGNSAKPSELSEYNVTLVVKDISDLIKAMKLQHVILVSHDWGGAVAWALTSMYPEYVQKLVILSAPHFGLYLDNFSVGQLLRSIYFVLFQVPILPELYIALNNFEFIFELVHKDAMRSPSTSLSIADAQAMQYYCSQPGVITPALNYYRNIFMMTQTDFEAISGNVSMPCLVLWGDSDRHLRTNLCDNLKTVAPNSTFVVIPNCSHWIQLDKPDQVNQFILDFIEGKEIVDLGKKKTN